MKEIKKNKEFDFLLQAFKEIATLKGIRRLLSWDQETYMPKGGQKTRAEQISLISKLIHEKLTDKQIGDNLNELINRIDINDSENDISVCIKYWKREHEKAVKLPNALVEELAFKCVIAHEAWVEAKKNKDFSVFLPHFSRLVELSIEKAKCLGYEEHPYDALLDEYEPETKTKDIDSIFSELVPQSKRLLNFIIEKQKRFSKIKIAGNYPIHKQKNLATIMATAIGYDFNRGRIDTVVHPFSTKIGPGDCRITTKWNEKNFTEAIFAILHEAGHGIYSQNLSEKAYGTPLGESISLGIHESQSRLWENIVGRSKEFWQYFLPVTRGMFPIELRELKLYDFLRYINWVEPSYIRIEADEVTYNLHIYLRFKIEKDLISSSLSPKDIPEAWNKLFEELFGIKVPDDSFGCLQDVHWSGANFGYFPTYSLGNIYAAMIMAAAQKEIEDLELLISIGDFQALTYWLKDNIYSQGRRYNAQKLIKKITGHEPDSKFFIDYLEKKYENLYD